MHRETPFDRTGAMTVRRPALPRAWWPGVLIAAAALLATVVIVSSVDDDGAPATPPHHVAATTTHAWPGANTVG